MTFSKKMRHWYWMPTTVLMIGTLSIFLLLWIQHISERLLIDEVLVDAVMDAQIRTATYHLRLEEVLSGVYPEGEKEVFSALDQAVKLVDLAINGGVAEFGQVLDPLDDPDLRARAEEIKALLLKLKMIGMGRLNGPEKHAADQLLEPQFESVFKEILGKTKELEDILERDEARNQGKSRRLFLSILVIWMLLLAVATTGLWRGGKQRIKAEQELVTANEKLLLHREELTKHREHLAELVENRTAELVAANKRVRAEMAERLQTSEALHKTEKEIQHLSGKLLRAQEVERKRISMELHDELGQALNVMKLRVRVVEKGLKTDQNAIREDCEELLEFIDQVIEDVRRLSLDLSPTVLEDLGLTAALRWLISNLDKIPDMKINANIAEIDHLFSENDWITIYRIIQEALTNIAKHAQAENVSIVIGPDDHTVAFSIDDDGEGFDPEHVLMKDASQKGFGLTTLNERVWIMGGALNLWSRKGEGTRIAFSIPIDQRRV